MKPLKMLPVLAAAVAAVAVAASSAEAHVLSAGAGGFGQGFAHPFGGLDHVLAMVAVGLWAAHLGGRGRWLVPVGFVAAMGLAGGAGLAGLAIPFVEAGIALSVVALGALVGLRARPTIAVAVALVAGFAVFHGIAHGVEAPLGAGPAYGLGFLAATAALHGLGLAVGMTALPARLAGGMAVAAGLLLVIV